jgi:dTDP-4-dehydrorhamnose 3,5-epimerase
MSYIFTKTKLQDAYIIEPKVFNDNRGYFFETYTKKDFWPIFKGDFVQENQSLSTTEGVIRGLHCQIGSFCQSKLVRVINGAVDDVIVDARKESPTFLKWDRIFLSADNHKTLFIPKGFLHGFVTKTKNVIFTYQVDAYYNKSSERAALYSDPLFGIDWGTDDPILSDKDKCNPLFQNAGIDFSFTGKI